MTLFDFLEDTLYNIGSHLGLVDTEQPELRDPGPPDPDGPPRFVLPPAPEGKEWRPQIGTTCYWTEQFTAISARELRRSRRRPRVDPNDEIAQGFIEDSVTVARQYNCSKR